MPITLADFKRPPHDNGRGLAGYPAAGWKGGDQGFDYWISELQQLGVKWLRVIDDNGDSLPLCQRLVAAGIFPIVRLIRRDLPPNDSPEPNPGHLSAREEVTIKKLLQAGVFYFETNNEPDTPAEWKQHAVPGNNEESAKLIALNWLFDARFILEAGGYPALPAVSSGSGMDLIGALAALGRHDILLDGCWIAAHNLGHNRPLNFPNDRVNQNGAPRAPEEYNFGALTEWAWWDTSLGRPNTLEEINNRRASRKNAGQVILHDHAAFREYEYFDTLAKKHLGRSIPIITTEGGYQVGRRMDARYPRITPGLQADLTVALFEFIQRDAPDYYFACLPWLMLSTTHTASDAWYSDFWDRAFRTGTVTNPEFPPIAVKDYRIGDRLPVIASVKAMLNMSRVGPRIAMPPPQQVQPAAVAAAAPPPPPPSEENIYLVQHGDSIGSIAKKFGVTVGAIAGLNALTENTRIFAGQRLSIPPPTEITPPPSPAGSYMTPPPASVAAASVAAPPPMPEWYAPPPAVPAANAAPMAPPASGSGYQSMPSSPPPPVAGVPPAPPRPPRPVAASLLDPRMAALNIHIERAQVDQGQVYWKLVRAAEYQDPAQAGGNHHMIYQLTDDKAKPVLVQRVFQGLANLQADSFTDAFGRAKIPMWETYNPDNGEVGPYSAWVAGVPSDKVIGLGMPNGMSVNFVLTWQKSVK